MPTKFNRTLLLLLLLGSLVLTLARCLGPESRDPRGPAFAGAASCTPCHKDIAAAHSGSAHFHSTDSAHAGTISGLKSASRFTYADGSYVENAQRPGGYYQALFAGGKEERSERLDIVFGGRHAQTFLFWKGDRTYELPLSYYNEAGRWGTSPAFPATHASFDRFIGANCFECHSSFIRSRRNASTAGIQEVLDRGTLIYGIDCERCHGPAAQHVAFHEENPDSTKPHYITRFSSLTRAQKLDVCAMCHSGNNKMQDRSTFWFRPGDTLAKYFVVWPGMDGHGSFDVHGNQFQLLQQSPCFLKTKTLDCSTCHDPHKDASHDLKAYSAVCSSCHQGVRHDFDGDPARVAAAAGNCIDCHMPLQDSKAITFQFTAAEARSPYRLRTHRIGIYTNADSLALARH